MPITVQSELENRIRSRADDEGVTVDHYLERLLREECAAIAHTETLLQEAADSGDYIELNEEEWDRMEREAVGEVNAKLKRRA